MTFSSYSTAAGHSGSGLIPEDSVNLIERVAAGDKSAYAGIVDYYKSMAYAVAYDRLGNFEDARDAAQDAFVAAYVHLPSLTDRAKFGPWLRRITANACNAQLRRRVPTAPFDRMQLLPDAVDALLTRLTVQQALTCLTAETRLIVTLYYFQAHSTAEIAGSLDLSVDAVKSRLRDARARLKTEMVTMIEGTLQNAIPDDFAARIAALIDSAVGGDSDRLHDLLSTDPSLVTVTGEVDAGSRDAMQQYNAHDGWTPLHLAAHYGHLPTVKLLVEYGADLEAVSQNAIGNTSISAAAWGNRLDIVEYLASQGANVDAPNAWGRTALHRAIDGGNWDTARLLVKLGADVEKIDGEGKTAAEMANEKGIKLRT